LNATLVRVGLPLLLLAVIVLSCASVFRVLGGERVNWHAALAGGAVSGVILLITPTVAGVLFTCYIVAFGLLRGAGVVARVQLGHRLRAPGYQPALGRGQLRPSSRDR
jgi:hypothetical protein